MTMKRQILLCRVIHVVLRMPCAVWAMCGRWPCPVERGCPGEMFIWYTLLIEYTSPRHWYGITVHWGKSGGCLFTCKSIVGYSQSLKIVIWQFTNNDRVFPNIEKKQSVLANMSVMLKWGLAILLCPPSSYVRSPLTFQIFDISSRNTGLILTQIGMHDP